MWTNNSAQAFLGEVKSLFEGMGLQLTVVGSVATQGESEKDLDILVNPLPGVHITLETALESVCEHFLKAFTVDTVQTLNPLPTDIPEEQTFINLGLRDGRTIELYFPERLFPFEEELPS